MFHHGAHPAHNGQHPLHIKLNGVGDGPTCSRRAQAWLTPMGRRGRSSRSASTLDAGHDSIGHPSSAAAVSGSLDFSPPNGLSPLPRPESWRSTAVRSARCCRSRTPVTRRRRKWRTGKFVSPRHYQPPPKTPMIRQCPLTPGEAALADQLHRLVDGLGRRARAAVRATLGKASLAVCALLVPEPFEQKVTPQVRLDPRACAGRSPHPVLGGRHQHSRAVDQAGAKGTRTVSCHVMCAIPCDRIVTAPWCP